MSLTCAADLRSPEEKDMRNSPMEMHTRASVFRMAIASSQNGSVVANIPAKDVPYLLNQYQFSFMSMKQIRLVSHLSMSMGLLLKIKEMFPGPEKGCSGVRLE